MSGNGLLTSFCGFSRNFLFSVDLNLKKVILQNILGWIFFKDIVYTTHLKLLAISLEHFLAIFFTKLKFNKTYEMFTNFKAHFSYCSKIDLV